MSSFTKDKQTGKWYCSDCKEQIPKNIITAHYNYFGANKKHKWKETS